MFWTRASLRLPWSTDGVSGGSKQVLHVASLARVDVEDELWERLLVVLSTFFLGGFGR